VINTYRFDNFHKGFVDILAAEQSMETRDWYQGTADAVRKNLKHLTSFYDVSHILILSGDQIYNMDFRDLLKTHEKTHSDLTISVHPVTAEEACQYGIVKVDKDRVADFFEKPKESYELSIMENYDYIQKKSSGIPHDRKYLASMGLYLFKVEALKELLNNEYKDFAKEIIPLAIETKKVSSHLFNDYWEDVGTIKSFWKANLDQALDTPKFDFYQNQIYTNARYLPPSKVIQCSIEDSLISEGSIIRSSNIKRSVIGIRSIINENVTLENSIIMGADYYETRLEMDQNEKNGHLNIGIGKNTLIKNAIIDKNARIGHNCIIVNKENRKDFDGPNYYIRDNVIIIPKNGLIPDFTII
jgi:glucose-1-phosphate adenylyltransferase